MTEYFSNGGPTEILSGGLLRAGYGEVTEITDSTYDYLLANVKAKMESISEMVEVIVGTWGNVTLSNRTANQFPCAEIVINQYNGVDYIDQRNIRTDFAFLINVHTYTETVDRIDGDDMKDLEDIAVAIKTQLYSFIDDVLLPCPGFRMTKPEYSVNLQYQLHTDHINTAEINVSFLVDTDDTTS